MIEFYLRMFGVIIDVNIAFPKRKKPKNTSEMPIKTESTNKQEKDEIVDEEKEVISIPTQIELQSKIFEEELKKCGIYDIPNASDLPPTYGINDDVEIITSEFEKEQEEAIERMR